MEEKPWADDELKIRELISEEAALMSLRGIGLNEQAKQLTDMYSTKVTRTTLQKLKNHPKYVDTLKKGFMEKVEAGIILSHSILAENAAVFANCLVANSKEGNIKAAIAALQILSGKDAKDAPEQKQAIQIILATEAKPERPV